MLSINSGYHHKVLNWGTAKGWALSTVYLFPTHQVLKAKRISGISAGEQPLPLSKAEVESVEPQEPLEMRASWGTTMRPQLGTTKSVIF